jgi:hypothetical protein
MMQLRNLFLGSHFSKFDGSVGAEPTTTATNRGHGVPLPTPAVEADPPVLQALVSNNEPVTGRLVDPCHAVLCKPQSRTGTTIDRGVDEHL